MGFREIEPDQLSFRRTLGLFATGVGLITVQSGTRIHGMTANAISSVSLEPPLVLACVGKQARLAGLVRETGGFSINFLSRDQEAVARHFAGSRSGTLPPEVHFEAWQCAPRLQGSLAAVGCHLVQAVDAGDHLILIGRVAAIAEGALDAQPLLFYRGGYQRLAPAGEHAAAEPDLMTSTGASLYYDEWSEHPSGESHGRHEP
ncbi:MAG TPA: flavin reductase family protein [Thermomicrobiaceae bacterium]|nr:flavin reductase family protein [Thermomicrobiaceae bacterium]